MDWKLVRELLDKYYAGTITVDEEIVLERHLNDSNVPEEVLADAQVFLACREIGLEEQGKTLDWDKVVDDLDLDQNNRTITLHRGHWLSVAASILLIVGISLLMRPIEKHQLPDSYSSPELAYAQSKAVLLLISQTMSQSMEPLENVKKMENSLDELKKLQAIKIVNTK